MSWEDANKSPYYFQDNMSQASKEITQAIELIEESKVSGRWFIVRLLKVALYWINHKTI